MKSLALLVLLASCRSAPGHFYTLVPPASAQAPSGTTTFELLPVEVPADVDRSQIVVRKGSGEITPNDSQSWIAPLPLELHRAFSEAIARDVDGRDIADAPIRVKLVIGRFESALDERALIDATWTIEKGDGRLTCSARATEKPKGGYPGLVEAHQKALGTIAAQIADDVKATAAATTPTKECARTASGSRSPATSRSSAAGTSSSSRAAY